MSNIQANNTYSLTNVKGGTCIDLSGGDNVSIIGFEFHNGPNQAWTFENAGGDQTFYLKSKGSGQYLAAGGDLNNGQKLIAASSPYGWRVEDAKGGVRLLAASDNNYCVDLANHGDSTPGTPVQIWNRWEGDNQIWKVQQVQ